VPAGSNSSPPLPRPHTCLPGPPTALPPIDTPPPPPPPLHLPARFSKISDVELLQRLQHVCEREGVAHVPEGLEAIIFTADGDMRQALNNLQVGGQQGGR
jgi:hypothetical protein